jgi:hypothetical protein
MFSSEGRHRLITGFFTCAGNTLYQYGKMEETERERYTKLSVTPVAGQF